MGLESMLIVGKAQGHDGFVNEYARFHCGNLSWDEKFSDLIDQAQKAHHKQMMYFVFSDDGETKIYTDRYSDPLVPIWDFDALIKVLEEREGGGLVMTESVIAYLKQFAKDDWGAGNKVVLHYGY